ncbi:MAG: pseudouridine synthase [Chryseolinea sp.]
MPSRKQPDRSKSRRGPSMGSGDAGGPFKKKREFQKPDSGKFSSARRAPRPDGDREKPTGGSSGSYDKKPRPTRDERASRNRPGGYKDQREGGTAGSHGDKRPRGASEGDGSFSGRDRSSDSKRQSGAPGSFGKRFPGKPSQGRSRDHERPEREKRSFDKPSDSKGSRKTTEGEKPFRRRSEGGFDKKPTSDSRPFAKRPTGTNEERPFRGRSEDRASGSPEKRPRRSSNDFTKSDSGGADSSRPVRSGARRERDDRSEGSGPEAPKKFDRTGVTKKDRAIKADVPTATPAKAAGTIRLNKYIANSGVCSRREADELITMGLISVNGKVVTTLGHKVSSDDEVRHESKVLRAEKPVYILMNKPKGFLTTTTDPQERNTVMNLLGGVIKERIYPVGRLDRNTTGLLMLTNDGDLADKLMHPSHNVKKIYKIELDRPLTKADATKVIEGVTLEEGRAIVDDLAVISDDRKTLGLEIHIGWNRVVRRIFESLSYQVVKLDRSSYAGLTKKDLGRGEWRFLKKEELILLKHFK